MRGRADAASQAPRQAQLVLELGHETARGEADFVVCAGNELAFGHIRAYPGWPGPLTLISGPPKVGKSHLGRIWAARAGAAMPAPDEVADAATAGGTAPLLVEDVDRAGYDEAGLFHLLNQSIRDRRPLLMTARAPVADWPYATADLKSRARLAAHFAVAAPDDTLLSQMFVKLFADRQVTVEPRIVAYLVARMERSAEAAATLVGVMDELALSRGRPVTRAIAAEALELVAAPGDNDSD